MDENTSENLSSGTADGSQDTEDSSQYEKYLIFSVRDKRYALPSGLISEVTAFDKVFPLPLIPPYLLGIINRYSVPYALIDLGFLFYGDASEAKKVIVLKENVEKTALLIDDVTDITDIALNNLINNEQEDDEVSGLVSGLFEWKDMPVFCLDVGELINRIRQDLEN